MFSRNISTHEVSRVALESHLIESGFWKTRELRSRHGYVLSPSTYVVHPDEYENLKRLASKLYPAVEKLNNHLCTIAIRKGISREDAQLLRIAHASARGLAFPEKCERRIPPVIKVDLIRGLCGGFFIAEVDAYNPRGLGYAALLDESVRGYLPSPTRFGGMSEMADLLRDHERKKGTCWTIIVSEAERYYDTAFKMLAKSLSAYNVPVDVVPASDIAEQGTCVIQDKHTLLIPDTLDRHPELREELLKEYELGKLHSFFPPTAYLGSKGFLPFLRTCEGMEEFIPPSILVGKKFRNDLEAFDQSKPSVLKAMVSSGMKQVLFSDLDSSIFTVKLTEVSAQKNASWILQKQVPQVPVSVPVFSDGETRSVGNYYLRITAYISKNGLLDIEVTGRPDRKVHGAPDCIQLPVIRTS